MTNANLPNNIIEAPEEVLSTMHKDGTRRWIYPTPSKGTLNTWRGVVAWALIVVFLGLPIVNIGGEPGVWLDVARRRFVMLGNVFYATDTMLLMLLGITILIAVVWITSLFGRVWCGWGCPQTVYLEFVFRPIERLIEGKESARKKLDAGPNDGHKVGKKIFKYAIFTAISAFLAHSFIAYFVSWGNLLEWMTISPKKHWTIFIFTFGLTGLILFNFAYFREQMCTIICPYARLQSVMIDSNSLIVSYDPKRGEPRGRRTKATQGQQLGDCVDCGACVRTCPTGIDIRDGLQLECIGCTQCIDACNSIMDRLGQPGGLIRYTSELGLEEGKTKVVRPRVLIYTALLVLFSTLLFFGVSGSSTLEIDVVRATGTPFMTLPDGKVANRLKFRVLNRTNDQQHLAFKVSQPKGASLRVVGRQEQHINQGEMQRFEIWVLAPAAAFVQGGAKTIIEVENTLKGTKQSVPFTLIGPEANAQTSPSKNL